MKWEIDSLIEGDLIRVKRSFYFHFGIFVGDGKVIHYSAENNDGIHDAKNVSVRIDTTEMFANGGIIEKANYSLKEKLIKRSNKEIISIAKSKIGEKGYDFLRNNCEDFAYSCVFKKKIKTQMDMFRQKVMDAIK